MAIVGSRWMTNGGFSQQRYCFYESQSWEGSDYIRWDPFACENADPSDNPSECSDPEFSTSQISSDMMAITNLYSRNLVRFLRTTEHRITAS